jgi:hypothetical protein
MTEADVYDKAIDLLAEHPDTITARKILRREEMRARQADPMPKTDQVVNCCAISAAIMALLFVVFH